MRTKEEFFDQPSETNNEEFKTGANRLSGRETEDAVAFIEQLFENILEDAIESDSSQEKRDNLVTNLSHIRETYFSYTPCVFSRIPLAKQLELASKLTRVPEIQRSFGAALVGEITYSMSFCSSDTILAVSESISQLPIPTKIDVIDMLKTVSVNSLANYSWASEAFENCNKLVELVAARADQPFVSIATGAYHKIVARESDRPTFTFVKFYGDPKDSRIAEQLPKHTKEESEYLQRRITADVPLSLSCEMAFVASDTVAIFDHSAMPAYYAHCDKEEIEGLDPSLSQKTLRRLENGILLTRQQPPRIKDEKFIDFIVDEVLPQMMELAGVLPEDQAGYLAEQIGILSEDEYGEFVLSRGYVKEANIGLANLYTDLKQQIKEGRIDASEAEDIFSSERERIENEIAEFVAMYFSYLDRLSANISLLISRIDALAKDSAKQEESQYCKLNFLRVQQLSGDSKINPFGTRHELTSLVQILLRPGIRHEIEQRLGNIDLCEISFAAQVNLIKFLTETDAEHFERLSQVLSANRSFARDILNAFLSCSQDISMGESVIAIAENLGNESRPVFEKYSSIVDGYLSIENLLKKLSSGVSKTSAFSDEQTQKIARKILDEGREILLSVLSSPSAEELPDKQAPQGVKSPINKEMLDSLAAHDAVLSIYKEAIRVQRESGQEVAPEYLYGVELTILTGPQISANDSEIMLQIARNNWTQPPDPTAPEAELIAGCMRKLEPVAIQGIIDGLSSDNNEFYILKVEGKIAGFMRLENTPQGVYFGSFNIHPSARGGSFGGWMVEKIISSKAADNTIVASSSPMQDVSGFYISPRGGFVVSGLTEDVAGTGEALFDLYRNDRENNAYTSWQMGQDQLVEAEKTGGKVGQITVFRHDHLSPEDYEKFVVNLKDQLARGNVMTRFFRHPKNSMVKYSVFEPKNQGVFQE